MFGYWLMHKWALEGRSIVFQKENFREQQHILFCRDGVFEIVDRDLLDELLGDSQTRYGIICSIYNTTHIIDGSYCKRSLLMFFLVAVGIWWMALPHSNSQLRQRRFSSHHQMRTSTMCGSLLEVLLILGRQTR